MIFDTDVLIWVLRGNARAAAVLDRAESRQTSIVTYMELLHGARDAAENRAPLCTANARHYRPIEELTLEIFRP